MHALHRGDPCCRGDGMSRDSSEASAAGAAPSRTRFFPCMESRFSSLENFFPDMESSFPNLKSFFSSMKSFFPSLENYFPSMETFFSSMESSFSYLESLFSSMESSFSGMENSFPSMKSSFSSMESFFPCLKIPFPCMENGRRSPDDEPHKSESWSVRGSSPRLPGLHPGSKTSVKAREGSLEGFATVHQAHIASMKARSHSPASASHAGCPPPGFRSTVFR